MTKLYEIFHEKSCPGRLDSGQPAQLQRLVRVLKYSVQYIDEMYDTQ